MPQTEKDKASTAPGDASVPVVPRGADVSAPVAVAAPPPAAAAPVDPSSADVAPPPSKKVKRESNPQVTLISDFNMATHAEIHPLRNGKIRGVKISVPDSKSALRIQFSSGGWIPRMYNVETNEHGKTMFSFNVTDETEIADIAKFQKAIIKVGQKFKRIWWPNDLVTDEAVASGFVDILTKGKPKKDDQGNLTEERWPSSMKVLVPMDKFTKKVSPFCSVMDHDGSSLTIYDTPGEKWSDVVVEFGDLYFSGKTTWGFGPKTLSNVMLAHMPYMNNREAATIVRKSK